MNGTRSATSSRRPAVIRSSTIELATFVSALAATVAYALHRFAAVGETPLVLGTLVIASIFGWTQPALRAASRRTGQLGPVVVRARRSPHA